MKSTFFIISLVCIFFYSCNSRTTKENGSIDNIVKFNLDKNTYNIHRINLIKDVEIINMDTDKAIWGTCNKIIKYKDRIYLMDREKMNAVFIYDDKGNFINQIDRKGQGPEEYLQLTDIFIDQEDATLNVVGRIDKKILKFDLDGNILYRIEKLPKIFSKFIKTNTSYLGYMGNYTEDKNSPFDIFELSNNLEIKNHYFSIDPTWESKSLMNLSIFSSYKNNTYIGQIMDYNIYSINNDALETIYTFDFGKATWPKDKKSYEERREILQNIDNNYVADIYHFQETDNHLVIMFLYKGQYLLGVYDKMNEKSYVATLDPYDGKYFHSFGEIIGIDETAIYTLVEPYHMKRFRDGKDEYNDFESDYPEQVKRLREEFPVIREDGNPFLIIYHLN